MAQNVKDIIQGTEFWKEGKEVISLCVGVWWEANKGLIPILKRVATRVY